MPAVRISNLPNNPPATIWAADGPDNNSTYPECWGCTARYAARYLAPGTAPRPTPQARRYTRCFGGWRRLKD